MSPGMEGVEIRWGLTNSTVHWYHCPRPRQFMKDIDVSPVCDEDRPAGMCDSANEEHVE